MADLGDFDWREFPAVSPSGGFLVQGRGGAVGNFEVVVPWPDGGLAHFWRDNDPEYTRYGVALTLHRGVPWAAWVAADERIVVARVVLGPGPDGTRRVAGLDRRAVLAQTSSASPALASQFGRLVLAWKGSGNDALNLACSDVLTDDATPVFGPATPLGETSDHGPALVAHRTGVLLAWTGRGAGKLNVAGVAAIGTTTGGFRITGIDDHVVLADTSAASPALASQYDRVFLAWKGSGNDALNLAVSPEGTRFGAVATLTETSHHGPALAADGTGLLLVWTGRGDGNPVAARVSVVGNTAGLFRVTGVQPGRVLPGEADGAPGVAGGVVVWPGDTKATFTTTVDGGRTFGPVTAFGSAMRWNGPTVFGSGPYVGATLIESDFREDAGRRLGNLEVDAIRADGGRESWWRGNATGVWSLVPGVGTGAATCGPSTYYTGAYFLSDGITELDRHGASAFVTVSPAATGFELSAQLNPTPKIVGPGPEFETGPPTFRRLGSAGGYVVRGLGIAAMVNTSAGGSETSWRDKGGPVGPTATPCVVAAVDDRGRLHLHRYSYDGEHLLSTTSFMEEAVVGGAVFGDLDGELVGRPGIMQGSWGYRAEDSLPFTLGHYGHLQLVVASRTGGFLHLDHDNGNVDDGTIPLAERWNGPVRVPGPIYDELSLIESTFATDGDHGNLEVAARRAGQRGFDLYWRDGHAAWLGPVTVGPPPQTPEEVARERAGAMRAFADEMVAAGRHERAARLLDERVGLLRPFAVADPDRFGPVLADAQAAVAVLVLRRRAVEPGADVTSIARELMTMSAELVSRRLREAAVVAQRAAVELFAAVVPTAEGRATYEWELAGARHNLIARLLEAGDRDGAVALAPDTIAGYRRYAEAPGGDPRQAAIQLQSLSGSWFSAYAAQAAAEEAAAAAQQLVSG